VAEEANRVLSEALQATAGRVIRAWDLLVGRMPRVSSTPVPGTGEGGEAAMDMSVTPIN